jgi:REP element-mobilizing transposase RayT
MEKWKGKYRIPSARADWWDYTKAGDYFITICTEDRIHFFGDCTNGKLQISVLGAIVQGLWFEIPKHFPNVILGEFVAMPNHIHGIISIAETQEVIQAKAPKADDFYSNISPKSNSIATIIRSYKSICTKYINLVAPELHFAWQTRYWDNIITSEQEFDNITNYILKNPSNWKEDIFYKDPHKFV